MDQFTQNTAPSWAWEPETPIAAGPVFLSWPPRPLAAAAWLVGRGYVLSLEVLYIGLALVIWFWLAPDLADCARLRPGWVLHLLGLNLGLVCIFAGGLHLYFHTFARQGTLHRYAGRELACRDARFLCGSQVIDNMVWTLASGVVLWTALECLLLWAWAAGIAPMLGWQANPLWFVALFPLLYLWESAHFYAVHRLLHWQPLYRLAHAVHHRNVVVGPWSGLAMHPLEHLLYFSSVLIHLVVASHPIHMFYLFNHLVMGGVVSHIGFADLQWKGRKLLDLASYYHQLHHRYFNCNYGTGVVPGDLWAGSFHDGTPAATARIMKAQRRPRASAAAR
jgi:lathosterol oxidase